MNALVTSKQQEISHLQLYLSFILHTITIFVIMHQRKAFQKALNINNYSLLQ